MDFQKIIDLVIKASCFMLNKKMIEHCETKAKKDYVTYVDLKINNFLKHKLSEINSQIGFFSEEEEGTLKDPCWILDPVDGTTNLVHGCNMSSISLALYFEQEIKFGVVYNPFTSELFTAEKGRGAFSNGNKLKVSSRKMPESIIEFGLAKHTENNDVNFNIAKEIFSECFDIRRICSAALVLCFVADSRLDGYFEEKLSPWDIAAGALILAEAGGKVTSFTGNQIDLSESTSIIASNHIIHDDLKRIINSHN